MPYIKKAAHLTTGGFKNENVTNKCRFVFNHSQIA